MKERTLPFALIGIAFLSAVLVTVSACSDGSSTDAGPSDAADTGRDAADTGPDAESEDSISIRVDQVRQHRTGAETDTGLQISVTLINGEGGQPVPLDDTFFKLRVTSGLLKSPVSPRSVAWVDGTVPSSGDALGDGAEFGPWLLAFDVDAYNDAPTELVFEVPGATVGDATIGDGRRASAAVVLEECVACDEPTGSGTVEPSVCTYLNRDLHHCGACLVGDGNTFGVYSDEPGSCSEGEFVCPDGMSRCEIDPGRADGFTYMGCFENQCQ